MGSRYRKVKRRERSQLLRDMEQVSKLHRITFCTSVISSSIIQLQRQEDGNWKEVSPCPRGRDPLSYHLEAGKDLTVKLVSSSGSAGLYRAAFSYSTSGVTESRTIYSQEFRVIENPEGH